MSPRFRGIMHSRERCRTEIWFRLMRWWHEPGCGANCSSKESAADAIQFADINGGRRGVFEK
jgi:hypothetical protein